VSTDAERRAAAALDDIVQAIDRYRTTVGDLSFEELTSDVVRYHAAERFVEIISEASRRIPQAWKARFPAIPWPDIASIGNVLRHNYSIVDRMVIYGLQHDPFAELEAVVRQLRLKHGPAIADTSGSEDRLPSVAPGGPTRDRSRLTAIIAERSFRCGEVFRLVSGVESNVYFNMKPTMFDAEGSALMAKLLVERLAEAGVDAVGGLEMGAVPIVAAAIVQSFAMGRPIQGFFVRKKAKEHGARLRIEGLKPGDTLQGKRVAIVDDVCTTGGSALAAIDEVRQAGGEIVLVLAIVDREEGAERLMREHGLAFDALFRAHEFIPAGFERLPPATR
jgi:orotate phosphoribosyltransferase